MTAGIKDIEVEVGATFELDVVWKDPDGNPIDNTGYAARAKIKDKYGGTTLISISTTAGGITLGGADGSISLEITPAVTETITNKYGVWDLEMVAPSGKVYRILKGDVNFDPEATTS